MPDDLLGRYLPAAFLRRLPPGEEHWRGRTVLLLWALGYPFELAWVLGMAHDARQAAHYEHAIARLDDQQLIDQLEATWSTRGDASGLSFVRPLRG